MTTTLEETFQHQIQAEPDEEMHRLVYADWLEEQGDPRAALVRLWCRLTPVAWLDLVCDTNSPPEFVEFVQNHPQWLEEAVAGLSGLQQGRLAMCLFTLKYMTGQDRIVRAIPLGKDRAKALRDFWLQGWVDPNQGHRHISIQSWFRHPDQFVKFREFMTVLSYYLYGANILPSRFNIWEFCSQYEIPVPETAT